MQGACRYLFAGAAHASFGAIPPHVVVVVAARAALPVIAVAARDREARCPYRASPLSLAHALAQSARRVCRVFPYDCSRSGRVVGVRG
jgi:hypothetical protein